MGRWFRSKRPALAPVAIGEGETELLLLAVEGEKLPVIRVLRERMGLRLGAAYGIVQAAPTRIARNLERDTAEALRDELRTAGAIVELRRVRRLRPVP